ncbi:hypothetical protein ABT56_22735 [Photobacterium aquae]|uniref:Lipoprotein n=1 Tax=Photobacterium aquae TaxID=1195763 RepID=A0A0J1GKN8_9GAMM|nr:hypothetical protein [Photobacterium aquae]KLV00280.1 hypothetical protein ABT56_22735 [Photobacterium aquae]
MKKTLVSLLALSSAVLVTGCSTINYGTDVKVDYFSEPAIDDVVSVYVGDYMLNQGQATTMEYLTVANNIDGIGYDVPRGSYARVGEYQGNSYFSPISTNGARVSFSPLMDPPIAIHINNEKKVCITTPTYQVASCYDGKFKVENRTVTDSQSFQQTLIYNGSVGKKINISYREFSNGTARGAFTNDVEYDMSKSNLINYKGAKIEVIDYDNTSIKFKVMKHFKNNTTINL